MLLFVKKKKKNFKLVIIIILDINFFGLFILMKFTLINVNVCEPAYVCCINYISYLPIQILHNNMHTYASR